MRLDDHRASGRERRGGVSSGDRKGEREVAAREIEDRPQRDQGAPEVRARTQNKVRVLRVETNVEITTVDDHVSEESELHGRALEFTTKARLGETCLTYCDLNELDGCSLECVGGSDECSRPRYRRLGGPR